MNKIRVSWLVAALGVAALVSAQSWRELPKNFLHLVEADFGKGADHPLSKLKFNLFSLSRGEQISRDLYRLIPELNIDTVRIASDFNNVVSGTPGKLTYDFKAMNSVIANLAKLDVQALMYFYPMPRPIENPAAGANRHKSPPLDFNQWKEIVAAYARRYREAGTPLGIYEIWNEPDIQEFWVGTEAEYQKLYAAAAEGIRLSDPDALIGGPSAAQYFYYESFPEFVVKNKLPLDAFIFHHYGSPAMREITDVAKSLARYPYFHTTEMNMNEYQSGDCCDWCNDDVRNRYEGAQQLLRDYKMFLDRPELTAVSWAWFQDPPRRAQSGGGCMGLVTQDGKRKAAFNAWKLYARMPVDRKAVHVVGPLEAMASADDHRASLLIWNTDAYERRFDVNLKNVPFSRGSIRVYRIDKKHASVGDGATEDLEPVETFKDVETGNWSWRGALAPHAIVYFESDDGSGISELAPVKVARVVRVNRYYPARGTKSYADFDRKTWIARLGMADERIADQEVGVTAEQLPETLQISISVDGKLQRIDANSLLGIRLDYFESGTYTKSVVFHGTWNGIDLYSGKRTAVMPWGTKRKPDRAVAVGDLTRFEIRPKQYAPAAWSGRVQMTFLFQNAGPGARAKIAVRGR